jgi:hypothetical protein
VLQVILIIQIVMAVVVVALVAPLMEQTVEAVLVQLYCLQRVDGIGTLAVAVVLVLRETLAAAAEEAVAVVGQA